jgi:hypothetical protein
MGIKIPKLIGVKLTGNFQVGQLKRCILKVAGFLPLKWNRAIVEYLECAYFYVLEKRTVGNLLCKLAFG